jgi:CheY-like chemotaxis protein
LGPAAAEVEQLRVIHEKAERAGRIVRNLLTFARKTTPGDAVVDLSDTIGRSALLLGYELHLHGTELVQDRLDEPLPVRGNGDELQQVLLNLITNAGHALRALPPGQRRRITLICAREGGRVVVRVRDTGPGVPAELVPQLFTPFFTTKEPGEGTGLGLSLSFRIIESHGGRLAYQPVAGGGAEFWFSLPLASGEREAVRTVPSVPLVNRAVLVLDNDPGTELVVRALFEPAGYQVEVARTGADIATRLAARAWQVVVVEGALSADGKVLVADQLSSRADQRVIITTADPLLAARCRARGLTIVSRPFLPRDLVEVAGDLIVPERSTGPQSVGSGQ